VRSVCAEKLQVPGVIVRRRIFFRATNLIGSFQNDGEDKVKAPTLASQGWGTHRNKVKDPTRDDGVWGTRPEKPQGPGEKHRAP
jgi:hypothetical protein